MYCGYSTLTFKEMMEVRFGRGVDNRITLESNFALTLILYLDTEISSHTAMFEISFNNEIHNISHKNCEK